MIQRPKLEEIDLVRGIAILGVLLVHATAWATVNMLDSNLFGIYNFLNIFCKFGTTTFLFLSSFVLFYQYYPQRMTRQRFVKFYRNRLLYIIIPYLFFSAVYYGYTWFFYGRGTDRLTVLKTFGENLLTGEAYYHLYFVFISVQFYLLFPLLLLFFQRFPRIAAYAFLIGLALQWAFFIWNYSDLHVSNRGSWSLSYFSHLFAGAWLGMHFDRVKLWLGAAKARATGRRAAGWIALWGIWLASGAAYVTMWYNARHDGAQYHSLLFDAVWNVYTLSTALVFVHAAFLLEKSRARLLKASLRNLGIVSFGVYLLHPLLLSSFERFPVNSGQAWLHHLWYADSFLFILFASWIVATVICRWMPFAWIAFGSVPARLRAKPRPQAEQFRQVGS